MSQLHPASNFRRRSAWWPGLRTAAVVLTLMGFTLSPERVEAEGGLPDFSNFELRIGQDALARKVAEAKLRLAQAALYPKINIGGETVLRGKIDYSPDITRTASNTYAKHDPDSIGVELSWRLFDGLRNVNDIAAARESLSSASAASLDTRQKLLLDVADKALSVIRDRAQLAALTASVKRYGQSYEIARRMLSDGMMTVSQAALAGSELEGAKALQAQAANALKSSELDYRKLTGEMPPAKLALFAPERKLPRSAETASLRAQSHSPLLKMAVHLEREAGYKAKSAAGLFFPTVDLVGRYTRTFDPSPPVDRVDNHAILLRMKMPIFDPTIQPALDLAKTEAAQRRYDREDTTLAISVEAQKQYDLVDSLSRQVDSLRRQIAQAERATTASRAEIQTGVRTITDLLDAEQSLLTASVSLAQTRYARSIATFRLLATMGNLDERDVGLSERSLSRNFSEAYNFTDF